jgi:hypothetical protein
LIVALIVSDWGGAGEGDAGVLRDDVGDAARDEEESGVVISLAENGDGFATEAADFAVGEDAFEAVADLSPIFVVVGGVEDEDAAANLLGADSPFCGEIVGVVEGGLVADGGDGDDGDLGFCFLVDLGAEGGEFGFGVGGEDVGEIADVAGGLVGELEGLLGLLGLGCEREGERENQKEESGARRPGAMGGDWESSGHLDLGLAYLDLMISRRGPYLIAWRGGGGILLRGVGGGFCGGETRDVELCDYGRAVLGAGGGVGGGVGFVGDDSVKSAVGMLIGSPIVFGLAEIKPGSLHCASRRVRRSEREEKASARFGRDDRPYSRRAARFGQGSTADCEMIFATDARR